MGFKNFGVFLLLLSVQLHPLLALRQKSLPNPSIATEGSLTSAKLGDDKPNIIAVNRLRGFGGSRGIGGGSGRSRSGSSGFSGAKRSTSTAKSGAVAGAAVGVATGAVANHLTSHDSNGAYLNSVSLSHLTLALLAYCFLLRF